MKRNEHGFSIVLVLGAIAILGVITVLVAEEWRQSKIKQLQTNGAQQATNIISNMAALIEDNGAWTHTIWYQPTNATLACLANNTNCSGNAGNAPPVGTYPVSAPGGNFTLLDKAGNVYYTSTTATNGFTMAGTACNSFNGTAGSGSDQCPFHVVLYWVATCGATVPCNSYTVTGYMLYNPKSASIFAHPFSPANYTFTINKNASGTVYFCCSIGCNHLTGDSGLAYATLSIFFSKDCYVGSPEIGNDFCNQALVTLPSSVDWVYSGYHSVPTSAGVAIPGSCPQGPPY